jgi:hypothetical protein
VKPAARYFTGRFDNPTLPSKNTARMGDEGKAVGCVPPTALLFEQAVQSIQDQQNQIRDQRDCRHPCYGEH